MAVLRVGALAEIVLSRGGCFGGRVIPDERSDQAQQFLLLRSFPAAEEHPKLDMGDVPAGGCVGLMPNEHCSGVIADQIPAIPVGAFIELPSLLHGLALSFPAQRNTV